MSYVDLSLETTQLQEVALPRMKGARPLHYRPFIRTSELESANLKLIPNFSSCPLFSLSMSGFHQHYQ